jgi:hypothetical protein
MILLAWTMIYFIYFDPRVGTVSGRRRGDSSQGRRRVARVAGSVTARAMRELVSFAGGIVLAPAAVAWLAGRGRLRRPVYRVPR